MSNEEQIPMEEEIPGNEPVSDKVSAYEVFKAMDFGAGTEIPRFGRKNCSWCNGRGFALINKETQVCKCLRPKSREEVEHQAGRMQAARLGKHTKGRSKYRGRKGKWVQVWKRMDEMSEEEKFSSAPSLKWQFHTE